MPTRKRRLLVGSLGSIVWPALVVLVPAGITFAAARVYAESAPAPEQCEAGIVTSCADASLGDRCAACASGNCACFNGACTDGGPGSFTEAMVCRDAPTCESFPDTDDACQGKATGDPCTVTAGTGTCQPGEITCLPNDGGPLMRTPRGSFCQPSSSSSGGSGTTAPTGTFVPGPPSVPGSSSSSGASASDDDSGCSTSPGTTRWPLLGAPLAIGLLLALRKRQARKAPSARKRS